MKLKLVFNNGIKIEIIVTPERKRKLFFMWYPYAYCQN